MANKRPAEQWYTGDWYRAVDVQKCGPATRGIWRDAIDAMTNEQITGKIRGTTEQVCRLLRCNEQEFQQFVLDNRQHRFANVTFRNGKVTIVCRRLYGLYLERKSNAVRQMRHRQKLQKPHNGDSNGEITPYSSSSSSNKENIQEKVVTFTLQQCKDVGFAIGLTEVKSEAFYNHYNSQGWLKGNGLPITDLQSAMVRWRNNSYKFEPKDKITPPKPKEQQDAERLKRIRDECTPYLKSKTTKALKDLLKDIGFLKRSGSKFLILEILAERK